MLVEPPINGLALLKRARGVLWALGKATCPSMAFCLVTVWGNHGSHFWLAACASRSNLQCSPAKHLTSSRLLISSLACKDLYLAMQAGRKKMWNPLNMLSIDRASACRVCFCSVVVWYAGFEFLWFCGRVWLVYLQNGGHPPYHQPTTPMLVFALRMSWKRPGDCFS